MDKKEEDIREVNEIILKHRGKKGALIPTLQETQESFGYLPEHVLHAIANGLRIPLSKIYSVVTFYTQFSLARRGKNIIKCCMGTACYVKGAKEIVNTIRRELALKEGENTTGDYKFTLEIAMCLGTCFLSPVIMVNNDYYGNLSPDKVPGVLKLYR
jgi:NADH-quinone oxidoreductase subunit E